MTADNLLHLLQQPEGLHRISYEELKTLALEYPYCPHVHLLLLFKSRLSDHKDFLSNLAGAAAHHVDRSSLRRRLIELDAAIQQSSLPLQEEVFELKPLAELEERLAGTRQAQPVELIGRKDPAPATLSVPAENLSLQAQPTAGIPVLDPEADAVPVFTENPAEKEHAPAEDVSGAPESAFSPEPMSKTTFRTWKRRQSLTLHHLPAESTSPPIAPGALRPSEPEQEYDLPDLRHLAEQSVEEKQDVASESLAALLARQGHIHKAVEMYERLCLHFPEKSAYFAARIENLKKTS